MLWNIAQAKQRFSEVVKQAACEPQLICNRSQTVAAVIGVAEYQTFDAWRRSQSASRTLADQFAELRGLLQEEGFADGLSLSPRADRVNAFAIILEEGHGEPLSG